MTILRKSPVSSRQLGVNCKSIKFIVYQCLMAKGTYLSMLLVTLQAEGFFLIGVNHRSNFFALDCTASGHDLFLP